MLSSFSSPLAQLSASLLLPPPHRGCLASSNRLGDLVPTSLRSPIWVDSAGSRVRPCFVIPAECTRLCCSGGWPRSRLEKQGACFMVGCFCFCFACSLSFPRLPLQSVNKGGHRVAGVDALKCGGSKIGGFKCRVFCRDSSATAAEISRPSATWGVIQSDVQQCQAREEVFEYLRAEGIITLELMELELPSSIEVVQERVDFLRKVGLENKDINSYPLMIGCSVRRNMVPVLDYLEKLGIEKRSLPQLLKKCPMVLQSSVVIDLMPVIDYIQGLDVKKKDIPSVLLRFPDVLGFKLEGTMSTSVAYLVSIGVNVKQIGRLLTEFPEILGMRVASVIKPKVDYLMSLGLPIATIARILERRPQLLGHGLSETIQPAVDELLRAGVQSESIASVIVQYPEILALPLNRILGAKINWLTSAVKVSRNDVPRIFEKFPQLLSIKEELAMDRINFLEKTGFSTANIAKMVIDCPQLLALSIEHALRPSLNFLTHHMKRDIDEAVNFPAFFTYNLETRVRPRYTMVARKGIVCSLAWLLSCSDEKFVERMNADFIVEKDVRPLFVTESPLPTCDGKDDKDREPNGRVPPNSVQVCGRRFDADCSHHLDRSPFQSGISEDGSESENRELSEESDGEEFESDALNRLLLQGQEGEDKFKFSDSVREVSDEWDEEEFELDLPAHLPLQGQESEDEQ